LATQAKRDYYEILSVTHTATEQEIKSSFQKLAAEFHAAGKPRDIDEVEYFRGIATAFRVLSDAKKRQQYDRLGFVPPPVEDIAFAGRISASPDKFWSEVGETFADVLEWSMDFGH